MPTSKRPLLRGSGLRIKRPHRSFSALASLKSECLFKPVARPANISGKEAVKAFEKAGWRVVGRVGSHVVPTKADVRANLSVPQQRELSLGTLRALIRHSGMTVEEFLDKL